MQTNDVTQRRGAGAEVRENQIQGREVLGAENNVIRWLKVFWEREA